MHVVINVPINGMPHLPILGARWGKGGDLLHFLLQGPTSWATTACQLLYQFLIHVIIRLSHLWREFMPHLP